MAKASKKDRKEPTSTSHPILPRPGTSRVVDRYTLRLQTAGDPLRAHVRFSIVVVEADGSLRYDPVEVQTVGDAGRAVLKEVDMDGTERTIPVFFDPARMPKEGCFVLIEVYNPANPSEKTLDLIWVQ